jgi:hypothetical protein
VKGCLNEGHCPLGNSQKILEELLYQQGLWVEESLHFLNEDLHRLFYQSSLTKPLPPWINSHFCFTDLKFHFFKFHIPGALSFISLLSYKHQPLPYPQTTANHEKQWTHLWTNPCEGQGCIGDKTQWTSHLVCSLTRILVSCTPFRRSKTICPAEGLSVFLSIAIWESWDPDIISNIKMTEMQRGRVVQGQLQVFQYG